MAIRHQNWQHVRGKRSVVGGGGLGQGKLDEGKAGMAMKNLCWPHDERIKNVANLWPKCNPQPSRCAEYKQWLYRQKASVGWLVGRLDGWLSPSIPGPAQIPFLRPSRVVRFWPSRAKVWIFYVALFWYHKSFSSWFSKVLRVTAFRSVVSAQFVSLRFFQFLHFAFVVFSPGFLEWLWPNLPLLLIDYVGYLIYIAYPFLAR